MEAAEEEQEIEEEEELTEKTATEAVKLAKIGGSDQTANVQKEFDEVKTTV